MVKKITLTLCAVLMLGTAGAQSVATCGTLAGGTLVVAPCVDYVGQCPHNYSMIHRREVDGSWSMSCILSASLAR
jgi:hypothetical protein